jgi:hypothetical protein
MSSRAGSDKNRHMAAGPIRGVLAERVVLGTLLDPYLSLKALADYSSLSVRMLRYCLDDPDHPLPCYQVNRKLLVRRSEFDTWVTRHRGRTDVDEIVRDVLQDL